MANVSVGLIWDFFPVMLIMVYHHHNFKERPEMYDSEDVEAVNLSIAE